MNRERRLEEQLEILAEHLGVDSSEDIITTFIKEKLIKLDDVVVNYAEYDNSTKYYVVLPLTERADRGLSASLSSGPVHRMTEHGLMITGVSAYENVEARTGKYSSKFWHHPTADKYISVEFEYVGSDHPIIELYEEDRKT